MIPAAMTKSLEIIDYLGTFKNRSKSNVFILKDCKKASREVCETSQTEGSIAFGAIACLEHDFASMHKYHKQSLESSLHSNHALKNYVISLNKSCLWWQSTAYLEQAYYNDPSDIEALHALIINCQLLGNFSRSSAIIDAWEKLNLGKTHPTHDSNSEALKFIEEGWITANNIETIIKIIGDTLSETDIIFSSYRFSVIREEESVFINYEFKPADANQDIINIENLVDESISRHAIPRDILDHITITFVDPSIEHMLLCFEENIAGAAANLITPDVAQLKRIEDLIDGVELD
jgi:hypothetical protein